MKIELLKGIKTLEELKAAYRKLAFKYHPDRNNGKCEMMQQLNNEYEYLSKILKNNKGQTENAEDSKEFISVIDELIKYEDIVIEIVGTWIWVSGNTKPIKETLKNLKFNWNRTRELWQRKPTDDKFRTRNSKMDDSWIKDKYGCKTIKGNPTFKPVLE